MGNDQADHHILSGVRCPTCKGRFSLLKFLGKKGNLYKVLVHCKNCGTYGIGTASIGDGPSFSPQVEAPMPLPVTAGDVLDMHEFLEGFDGNFAALFAK
ncbi:MAG: hypothetical protein HY675_26205 [Chloroflexi bacterium]|nr:hypothetical protein [Chloroflexota bacterium]